MELNLNTGTHKPFVKPNNTILYVDVNSNHTQSMKKNIPLALYKRLSPLSSNEEIFNSAAPPYQEALYKAGHKHKFKYNPMATLCASGKWYRAKQNIWFNPPHSQNAEFLKAVDSFFPEGHPLCPIFNRNTLKVSYKTTANMAQVVSRDNKKLATKIPDKDALAISDCNCQKSNLPCIMGGNCVPGCVVYQGAVTRKDTGKTDFYTGLSELSWKLVISKCHNHVNLSVFNRPGVAGAVL